jgi:2-polyprenyl-3-methyl-5-hydroxy-6-metoxy-1,4-benzoquinol methylase/glycosyltransferase involved in cell wall biosynthesis
MPEATQEGRKIVDIVIHAMGLPFNGETIKTKSLGGSESAAYYQAKELASRGHRVQLWTTHRDGGTWDGVIYTPVGNVNEANPLGDAFTYYATRTPHDVLIIQRHPLAFHKDWACKIGIHQMHDVALYRSIPMINGGLCRVDFTTGVSHWHTNQIHEVSGVQKHALRVIPNGVDPTLYQGPFEQHPTALGLHTDGKFVLLYQSRPERGLENLLKPDGIMAKLAESGSNAHLVICGYDNTQAQMVPYYQQLQAWGEQLPNVTPLGSLNKSDLAALQRSVDLLVYPTAFAEVSCITAMEAMHAGLPMLTSDYAALTETCADSGTILVPLGGKVPSVALDNLIGGMAQQKVNIDKFVSHIKGLENNPKRMTQLSQAQRAAAHRHTWSGAVDKLEAAIEDAFAQRSTPTRTLRHLIEHSDIVVAKTLLNDEGVTGNAIGKRARKELDVMYAFADPNGDPEAIKKHYAHWEGLNCDKLALRGTIDQEIEAFMQTTRFRGVLQFISRAVHEAKALRGEIELPVDDGNAAREAVVTVTEPIRIMEYGCAHGHLLLPLAKIFQDVEFVGVDFMEKSVKMANETAAKYGLTNVRFVQGDQNSFAALDIGDFDVVLAAEVLEHVWDYQAVIRQFQTRMKPESVLVTTTPCGRWEWSGRDYWPLGRQHLHHFEAADLLDIFGPWGLNRDTDMLYAPGEGHDGAAAQVGSWICYLTPGSPPMGQIDVKRKLRYLAPRQTVSLCMIVKDGEATLTKGLKQILPYVDEVIVGVDIDTTDDTIPVLNKMKERFPWVPFDVFPIKSPLVQGFDSARNETIDKACGDWILWMDADEEVPHAGNIWRYLRPSSFNAYACQQIHYSINPPQVLQTDWPCRLFRNHRGTKFYGLVHEHPEDKAGEAIPGSAMVGDVIFVHSGYTDEDMRRGKYQRNLSLLMRDVEVHPDRYLNKYLLMRDIAQGIIFEQQMTGGLGDDVVSRANKGVELFKELIDLKKPVLRMVQDCLPFYSTCVEALGIPGAFNAEISLKVNRVGTPTMTANTVVSGRFADPETYMKFVNLIQRESTKHYDSKYA